MSKAVLKTDGGSRGNPGVAGLGFVLCSENGEIITQGGWCLNHATNNVAEYSALIWGLKNALELGINEISIFADSELMVKQINGEYKVKNDDLRTLFMQAKSLLMQFKRATISHIYREENKEADRLANEAMDAHDAVGDFKIPWEDRPLNLFENTSDVSITPQTTRDISELSNEREVSIVENAQNYETIVRNAPYEGPYKLSGETFEHVGGHYEMTVKDHFDASHILVGYDGPCQYLHGHTWEVEATIAGEHLDHVGILYDFKSIKCDLHAVLENFDHRHINDTPPFDVINPTAENLARVIFFELEKSFPNGVVLQEIAVWESPAAKVTFRP